MSHRYELSPGGGLPASLRQFRGLASVCPGHDRRLFRQDAPHRPSSTRPRVVVAIPVRNEASHIGPCLRALAQQESARADQVLLLLNVCTDGTEACIRDVAQDLDLNIAIVE